MKGSARLRRASPLHPCCNSFWEPHRAEAFPAAVRELLVHPEHRATNLLRLATRRCDEGSREGTPLDCPSVPDRHVLGFRNEGQHLDWASRRAFVGLSDSWLADLCRRVWAETNGVIGPEIRHRNSISRNRRGDVLPFQLLDGGPVRIATSVASSRRGRSLNHLPWRRGQRADNDSNWGPHPAEDFPAAVRELPEHPEPRTTNLLRLGTRRFDIRTSEVPPLDCPAVPDGHVLDFRNVGQHLDAWPSRPSLVALSDSLLADLCRLARAETNGVVGPQIRQCNRISRQRSGDVLLVEFLDGGQVGRGPCRFQQTQLVPEPPSLPTRSTRRRRQQRKAPSYPLQRSVVPGLCPRAQDLRAQDAATMSWASVVWADACA